MAAATAETPYQRRRAREDARARQEGELAERQRQLEARERQMAASRASAASRSSGPSAGSVVGRVHRTPYLALSVATAAISWVQLARNGNLTHAQKRAAVFASILLLLAVALVGEASPEIATMFAGLLFVSVLLGGTNAVSYLFTELPHRLLTAGAGQ